MLRCQDAETPSGFAAYHSVFSFFFASVSFFFSRKKEKRNEDIKKMENSKNFRDPETSSG